MGFTYMEEGGVEKRVCIITRTPPAGGFEGPPAEVLELEKAELGELIAEGCSVTRRPSCGCP